ncbi:MAG: DeoR family transcriptional regulator [Deltaproteobacteria bacterium]|nr:DeoR family transcriptional regulator [Deltaproteobacteria bacterium]
MQGHAMVAMGHVKAGLAMLGRAASLAEAQGFDGHHAAIEIALASYEARYGGRPPHEAIARLEAAQQAHVHDSYSARSLMLDRAALLAFVGRSDEAWALLHDTDRMVIPTGDERMAIRLALTTAIVASLREGAEPARVHVREAEARLAGYWDRALRVEVLCAKAWTVADDERAALARELSDAARETGIARAAVFARVLSPEAPMPASVRVREFEDDRFGALLLALEDPACVARLLRDGYLGLLPRALGLAPGRRLYLGDGGALVVERNGNLASSKPGEGTLRLLRVLGDGRWWTKEELLATVWSIATYRPERHDSVVYMAIARARQALGDCREWLENDQGSYRLGGVECRALGATGEGTASGSMPPPQMQAAHATADDLADVSADREGAIVFLRTHGNVTTGALAKALGVSEMTALRELRRLVDDGVLRRTGRGRATRYELVEPR